MSEVSIIGLDIAKHVFQAHGVDTSDVRSRAHGPNRSRPHLARGDTYTVISNRQVASARTRRWTTASKTAICSRSCL